MNALLERSLLDQGPVSRALMGLGAEPAAGSGLLDFGQLPTVGGGFAPLPGSGAGGLGNLPPLGTGSLPPLDFGTIGTPPPSGGGAGDGDGGGGGSGSLPGGFTPIPIGSGPGGSFGDLTGGGFTFDNPFGPLPDDGGTGGGGGGGTGGGGTGGGGAGGGGTGGGGGTADPTPPSADGASIMVIGDSFTIPSRGFPTYLGETLDGLGYDIEVIAFSRSGDTAAQALGRLEAYLANPANALPDMALIALGTNDAVQELRPAVTKDRLDSMIDLFAARDIEVLLTQPDAYYPNRVSGPKGFDTPAEQNAFLQLFEELAAENDVVFARDFHAGLDDPANLESDGFHPNQAGTQLMAQNITTELDALVQSYLADVPVA